ncbi:hypothetical protein H0H81_007260 [Sphagnurus paluster]|uniref:VHS domain-containing protein n=1 Tax=Sphagnurus paluster TaxID=117069 RepID=A0A9P7GNM1_9AGAR|nr:hypothetical protein H0H81_007260 [Sphagnurus paluster]
MKKLFGGHGKPKAVKLPTPPPEPRPPPTEDSWQVVDDSHTRSTPNAPYASTVSPSRNSSFASLPPGASPPIPSPNALRSPSPFSINSSLPARDRDRDREQPPPPLRKKQPQTAPAALRILGSLDPSNAPSRASVDLPLLPHVDLPREKDPPEKKEKRIPFWSRGDRDKDKDLEKEKEKDRERDIKERASRDHPRDEPAELTRMIGYLTATSSEDWSIVMDVCERASANEANAKEAVRALRREFKYGEPPAQLAAARLWAVMLRNSAEPFISQSTARKFLDTLEDLLSTPKTSPVVRERVLDVISAAAYASGTNSAFRALWKRVKPADKPEQGVPLDNADAMYTPPVSGRLSHYDNSIPLIAHQEPSPVYPTDLAPLTPQPNPPRRKRSPESRNRIIPPDEDIRRLFQECKIGVGNASLLSQALLHSKPEELKKKDVIKEFYVKCRASQELIFVQIPWASAGAEQSRAQRDQEALLQGMSEEQRVEQTTKEKLLAALLTANAELVDALQQYDDLERVAMERLAEEVSRKETRMDRRQLQQYQDGSETSFSMAGSSPNPSRPPSPSPVPVPAPVPYNSHSHTHSHSHSHSHSQSGLDLGSLAPPPPAPNGPRSPAHSQTHGSHNHNHPYGQSRTPSPGTPVLENTNTHMNTHAVAGPRLRRSSVSLSRSSTVDEYTPVMPSAKALGKRRVVEEDTPTQPGTGDPFDDRDATFSVDDPPESDDDRSTHDSVWPRHRPVQYVYDAAAERTQQRIREGHALVVNGVH